MAKRKPKGSVFLRGRVYWLKYYRAGQPFREWAHTNSHAEAECLLIRRLGEIATGRFAGLAIERLKMGELLKEVQTDYEENRRGSLAQLRSRLKNHLIPAFGHLRAVNFGTDDLKRYRAHRQRQGASPSTINRELEIVGRAWTLALKSDPPKVTRILHIPMYGGNNTRTRFLEDDRYRVLLQELPDYLKPLFLIAYHVPSRRGELTKLEFTQLNFVDDQIVLSPGTTKNKEGRRMPMFGPMKKCLMMQKSIRDAKFPDCPYVFFGENGGRIVDFRKAWAEASSRAGVPELLFHDLRRTAARNMRRAGISEHVIMKIAGWKTNSMFRRYDIVDGRDLRDAARKMEEHIKATADRSTGTNTGYT